ncbi:M61 family metallopeptidase [Reichenbachiella versicolor]|uniref:M61 family metallopeptidase n=1 Tax=Reichenbachiella versicolor TaxID=1821036 RepID=UPI000D6E747F|nr:M61 family metallopeptidase [Reichenbachiella versicolor]
MIKIDITLQSPLSHLVHIDITFPVSNSNTNVYIPLWRPGRYERADFANNFRKVIARHKENELQVLKSLSHKWEINTSEVREFTFSYDYYAFKMDAGNSVFDEFQVYFNFISCIAYIPELINQPVEVSIDIPRTYEVACPLPFENRILKASSYHVLVDSPFLASKKLKKLPYQVDDYQFEVWINGKHPLSDEKIISDFKKFTRDQIQSFGYFPTKKYQFIVQSLDYKHYHGVEHQNSTVLILGPNDPESKNDYYEKLMGVASHELFHTWNVTRIRPKEMSPYEYQNEISHPTGFASEGFTTYYGELFLKTSDTYSLDMYLKELNSLCNRHFQNFGRHRTSLIDSSLNLWIDGYKNTPSSQKVSIYVKGALCALILDLEIRHGSNHKYSLLDVVKEMMEYYTFDQGGYVKKDIFSLFKKYGGQQILELAHILYETADDVEPYLKNALALVGLELKLKSPEDMFCHFTGVKVSNQKIVDIVDQSPFLNQLSIGDKIIEVNNKPFDIRSNSFPKRIQLKRDEKTINLELLQDGSSFLWNYHLQKINNITSEQQRNREQWLK